MARRRRIKPQKSYMPPSARGRTLVKDSLPTGSANSIHHSEESAAPPVKAIVPPVKKKAAPKKAAPKKAVAPKAAKKPAPVPVPAPKPKAEEKPAPAPVKKAEPKKAEPKRAHEGDGKFKADDPATTEKNEAWKGGKSPAKPKWNSEMTKRELLKFLPKDTKLTTKSSKNAILKALGTKAS